MYISPVGTQHPSIYDRVAYIEPVFTRVTPYKAVSLTREYQDEKIRYDKWKEIHDFYEHFVEGHKIYINA